MRRGHRERGKGCGGDCSGGGGSATDSSSRRVGQDDKNTEEVLDEEGGVHVSLSREAAHEEVRD